MIKDQAGKTDKTPRHPLIVPIVSYQTRAGKSETIYPQIFATISETEKSIATAVKEAQTDGSSVVVQFVSTAPATCGIAVSRWWVG